jgi:hypothetical protein
VGAWQPVAEVREVVIDQILDGGQVAAVPDFFEEAADNRAIVLFESHQTLPFCWFPESRAEPGSPSDPGQEDPRARPPQAGDGADPGLLSRQRLQPENRYPDI